MVPDAEFRSYYGLPVINPPVWEEREIAGYIFLGGLAGASSAMAAGAALTGRPGLARAAKLASALAMTGSMGALVKDLGKPSRFYNMLRTFKPTSPMSVGSWILAGFAPAAFIAAGTDLTGRFPRTGTAATLGAAVLGPAVSTYTAVLLADTAVPAWREGWRELPPLFAGSSLAAAAGVGLAAAPAGQSGPAVGMAVIGAAVELTASARLESATGLAGQAYSAPEAARLLRAGRVLTAAGAGGALAARLLGSGGRARPFRRRSIGALSRASGAALILASACTRFGVFRGGMASARDPQYTVVPQRARLDSGSAGGGQAGAGHPHVAAAPGHAGAVQVGE